MCTWLSRPSWFGWWTSVKGPYLIYVLFWKCSHQWLSSDCCSKYQSWGHLHVVAWTNMCLFFCFLHLFHLLYSVSTLLAMLLHVLVATMRGMGSWPMMQNHLHLWGACMLFFYVILVFFMVVIEPVWDVHSLATHGQVTVVMAGNGRSHGFRGLHDVLVQPLISDFGCCSHWFADFFYYLINV